VHDTGKELIWIKPQDIKDCIMVYNYKPRDFTAGDDRAAKARVSYTGTYLPNIRYEVL